MSTNYKYNPEGNGGKYTANIVNIITELENIKGVISGSVGGTIADGIVTQLQGGLQSLQNNLNQFKVDVEKFIDEGELREKLSTLITSLESKANTVDINTNIETLNRNISQLQAKVLEVANEIQGVDLSPYRTEEQINTIVDGKISSALRNIEPTIEKVTGEKLKSKETEIGQNIEATVGNKLREYKGNTFVFENQNASGDWVITHNLNRYPSVTVVDTGGNEIIGDVKYSNSNEIIITFNGVFSGKAFLN